MWNKNFNNTENEILEKANPIESLVLTVIESGLQPVLHDMKKKTVNAG